MCHHHLISSSPVSNFYQEIHKMYGWLLTITDTVRRLNRLSNSPKFWLNYPFTMLNCEEKNLLSELIHGLMAAKQLQAQLGGAPSPSQPPTSSFSSSCLTTEMKETLLHQIVCSYEKAILMINGSVQHNRTTETLELVVDPLANSGKVPESPTSITGSPRSEEFLDEGSKDYNLSPKKR